MMKKPFRRAFIEITNSCNLACGFCASSSRPKTEMTLENFERAAAQAGELAAVLFLHLLGEPLIDFQLFAQGLHLGRNDREPAPGQPPRLGLDPLGHDP